MKQKHILLLACTMAATSLRLHAQDSPRLNDYRTLVETYSLDLRAARHAAGAGQEARQSAHADFLPKLSGGANFNYTGNPLRLDVNLPGTDAAYTFEGRDMKYGASLNLSQPLYTGGALRAGYDKARAEEAMARQEVQRVTNNLRHEADVRYWTSVARLELAGVAGDYRRAVEQLVGVVRHRVEQEYTDRNDLLMAEVRLNDANYQVQRARNEAEVARLSLNALAGYPADRHIATDTLVENIVKHNVISLSRPMTVTVEAVADDNDGSTWLRVSNPIHPKLGALTGGKGLANLNQRYHLLCDKEIKVDRENDCFTVKVPLFYE